GVVRMVMHAGEIRGHQQQQAHERDPGALLAKRHGGDSMYIFLYTQCGNLVAMSNILDTTASSLSGNTLVLSAQPGARIPQMKIDESELTALLERYSTAMADHEKCLTALVDAMLTEMPTADLLESERRSQLDLIAARER